MKREKNRMTVEDWGGGVLFYRRWSGEVALVK